MILKRKIIFQKTPFDIPLIIFFLSQLISTIISIHPYTSFWGYYSRFHQGLLSTIAYLILYWALVSNVNFKEVKKIIAFGLASGFLVAGWGILEHFGIDKGRWVQDVQARVFSTLGQPNWLAAYLSVLIFLLWALKNDLKNKKRLGYLVYIVFFACLIFTKSRSGFVGFLGGTVVIGLLATCRHPQNQSNLGKRLVPWLLIGLGLVITFGTPFSPSALHRWSKKPLAKTPPPPGLLITPSTDIRKIVWSGAWELFKKYPLLGTGTETFAYSYYWVRPTEHNLVSEWDFLYNKAHNEYLNFATNNGAIGLIAYLLLPLTFIVWTIKNKKNKQNLFLAACLAAFISIMISNFFGFSVTIIAVYFYLLPGFAFLAVNSEPEEKGHSSKQVSFWPKKLKFTLSSRLKAKPTYFLQKTNNQFPIGRIALLATGLMSAWLMLQIVNYWRADYFFAQAKKDYFSGQYPQSLDNIQEAINLRSGQAEYWAWEGEILAGSALINYEANPDNRQWQKQADKAISASEQSLKLNPFHLNLYKQSAQNYYTLAKINPNYLKLSLKSILQGLVLAPTDAKLYYNAGLMYQALTDDTAAEKYLIKAVALKSNYEAARFQLAQFYFRKKQTKKAVTQLKFILEKINPGNKAAKKLLLQSKD